MSEKNFDDIAIRVKDLLSEIDCISGGAAELMAVTKFQPLEAIDAAVKAGVALVGESRGQEFRDKYETLASIGVRKHFIGNLQKNKLKYIVGKADVIESVSDIEIAKAISEYSAARGLIQDILIELNAGREASKSGFLPEDLVASVEAISRLEGVRIRGVMSMAPIAEAAKVETAFELANKLFIDISNKKLDNVSMDFLSMGMSRDYRLALKHGSNIVRIGRAIFGDR